MAFGAAVHRVDDAIANLAEQVAISAIRAQAFSDKHGARKRLSVIRRIVLELALRGRR